MENPTFKLQGIIKSKESSEDFEGPLILILHLLSKNKVEIRDIQISLILDQYLKYLDEMKQMDLEIASEFITMASHLT
jgi:segregation and condensation protein A